MNELAQRWKSDRGRLLQQAFLSPDRARSEGWGRLDSGQFDFRAMHLRDIAAPAMCVLVGDLKSCDLGGSDLSRVVFQGCKIIDTNFEDARFYDSHFRGNTVVGTSFDRADLRSAFISLIDFETGRTTAFEKCRFRKADLRKVHASNGQFVDCDFPDARFDGTWFSGTIFTRCAFAGKMEDVVFDSLPARLPDESDAALERRHRTNPGRLVDCDFSRAVFTDVEFRQMPLDSVKLPDPAKHVFIYDWRCVLPRALEIARLDGDAGIGLAARLKVFLEWADARMPVAILSPRSFPKSGPDNWSYVESVLARAAAWCKERRQ